MKKRIITGLIWANTRCRTATEMMSCRSGMTRRKAIRHLAFTAGPIDPFRFCEASALLLEPIAAHFKVFQT
jgi:hypothetical protein